MFLAVARPLQFRRWKSGIISATGPKHHVARSFSERSRIILRGALRIPSKKVASALGAHEHTLGKWRRRLIKDHLDGSLDEPHQGGPRTIEDDRVVAVIKGRLR